MIRAISMLISTLMIGSGIWIAFQKDSVLYGRTLDRSETLIFGLLLAGAGFAYFIRDIKKGLAKSGNSREVES